MVFVQKFRLALLLSFSFPAFLAAKELGKADANGQVVRVIAEELAMNKITSLRVIIEASSQLKGSATTLLSFDARMPEHNHGMLLKPRLSKVKEGEYLIEGVKLHMPGRWEFTLKIKQGPKENELIIPYLLP